MTVDHGNGDYGSGSFTPTAAGTYRWIASYSGDADNAPASGACNDAGENVIVTKANPTVATNASANVEVGNPINDTATLAGGFNPTGTITFNLYGPDDASCGAAVSSPGPSGQRQRRLQLRPDFTPTQAGTYRWIANYSGDANNNATANGCNGANENVVRHPEEPDAHDQRVG